MRMFVAAALVACCLSSPALGQDEAAALSDAEWKEWMPDASTLSMPVLDFDASENDTDNFHKYYYFYRPEIGFEAALADLRTCDELARGLSRGTYASIASASGGMLGGMLADAVHGSAEARRKRRVNMRRCMFYKGYQRHGISKVLWEEFNFEEGNANIEESDRQNMLAQQALVASGSKPSSKELGL